MSSSRVRAVYLAAESTYGTDPDSDGSDYVALRVNGEPEPVDGTEVEDVGNASGRNAPNDLVITRSGAKLDLEIPLYGYATSSGDGTAAPTADALDLILANALGAAVQASAGEGVATGSTTSNLVLDATVGTLAIGSLVPIIVTASSRVSWRRVSVISGAPTYDVVPDWATAPVTADVLQGARSYGQADDLSTMTTGLACVVEVAGTLHRLLGGRVVSLSIEAVAGKVPTVKASLMFDSWEQGVSMASLPAITTHTAPMVQRLAPFLWGSTQYPTKSVKLDFGISAPERAATEGSNARANFETVSIDPVITVEPAWAPSSWNVAFAAGTVAHAFAQFGGVYAGSRSASAAFSGLRAQVQAPPTAMSDGGYLRNSVQLRVLDSGGAGLYRWMFGRC